MWEDTSAHLESLRDRQALEALVVDNPDLERLEALLAQFNIFDAIGVARQELRHSDFLAFLLDPRQNHGLGDAFVKRLVQRAVMAAPDGHAPLTAIDLDVWSLHDIVVMREWRNIDILLLDEPHHLAILVENKIGSAEHSDQLGRYLRIVHDTYVGWKVLPLYLTPDGDTPSDQRYVAIDYGLVTEVVDGLAETRRSAMDPAVHTLMTHYARTLRRHVVSDSQIAELCRRLYGKHKRALDLIYEHRPDRQAQLYDLLAELVRGTPDLVPDVSSKQYVRFGVTAWDHPVLRSGTGWTKTGRILLFEFENAPEKLALGLYVGPGPAETRQLLVERARDHMPPFKVGKSSTKYHHSIYRRSFLLASDLEHPDWDQVEAKVRQRWQEFVTTDLPPMITSLNVSVIESEAVPAAPTPKSS